MSNTVIGKGELNLEDIRYLLEKEENMKGDGTSETEKVNVNDAGQEFWIPVLSSQSSKQTGNLLISLKILPGEK
jgi:hypothetical protein